MKNTVILAGHVGSNQEVRTTQNGASTTSLSLATTRSYKDSEGRCMNDPLALSRPHAGLPTGHRSPSYAR